MARLFVSDVHLDAAAPLATEQFLGFLREEAAGAEALYILGDLFEAWVGDDDEEPGNERVCVALRELTHGDALCTDDHPYQELRSIVRQPSWQQRFLALPRPHREQLADEARAGSRRHTSRTVPYIMDVNTQAVTAAFRAGRVRRIIHGHTHRPGVHELEVDGARAQRIVLGAWYEQGSVLRYERGRYELRTLPRPERSAHTA